MLFRNGADIAHLAELDQKLWTALNCPTKGIRFGAKALELLDSVLPGCSRKNAATPVCNVTVEVSAAPAVE